jgi:hypothetical protein
MDGEQQSTTVFEPNHSNRSFFDVSNSSSVSSTLIQELKKPVDAP